jgi:hypothetical protein
MGEGEEGCEESGLIPRRLQSAVRSTNGCRWRPRNQRRSPIFDSATLLVEDARRSPVKISCIEITLSGPHHHSVHLVHAMIRDDLFGLCSAPPQQQANSLIEREQYFGIRPSESAAHAGVFPILLNRDYWIVAAHKEGVGRREHEIVLELTF